MNLLKRYLDEMLGRDVLVVTVDGRAFKGELSEYDMDALVLSNVIETSTREVKWNHPAITVPSSPDGMTGSKVHRLDEALMPLPSILRVWRL